MSWIVASIRQPVSVTVGVVLILLAGLISIQRIPIQLTPNVEDTIVAVTTRWDGASPDEVEQRVVDPQEEKLQGIASLKQITSVSRQGGGTVRLEFATGTPKDAALREVSDKLRQVPSYPLGVDEPVVEASDPENRDFIAWIVFEATDPSIDVRTLRDFAEDRIKPVFERVPGMAEVNVLGGREREVHVRFDPVLLAERGITVAELAAALRSTNLNASAGALAEDKSDVRLRYVSQYSSVEEIERTSVRMTAAGTVRVRDVAEVVQTFKEPVTFVRSRGKQVIAINAQREVGSNVMAVMAGLRAAVAEMNQPGGLLESYARSHSIPGELRLTQVYDQTIYIDDALALVRNNIWIGGALAMAVLLLFLRSLRSAGVIALAIPISVIGAVVVLVALGRSVNVISLAGMAFAVGMVVDNAIVVLENIHRHLEMGKPALRAAADGAQEVFGAVLAATLTTLVVFVPILLIQEEAGQLFRDIALAIVAAVGLSLLVSLTVIPSSTARLFARLEGRASKARKRSRLARALALPFVPLVRAPDWIARSVHLLCGSVLLRLGLVALLTALSIAGTWLLMPPKDYLPVGNRNLVFGLLIPPPGYSLDQQEELGRRIESTVRPFWEASRLEPGSPERAAAIAALEPVPYLDATWRPAGTIVPPALDNYFLVSFDGIMFHGGISAEPERVVDMKALFEHATRSEKVPGVMAFAFQVPLFRLGGSSGSAVKINFSGDDLGEVSRAALAVFMDMMGRYGPGTVQPDPGNFNVPTRELQVRPDLLRLSEAGMSPADLSVAVQAFGDGALIGDYRSGGDTIDLQLISTRALEQGSLADLGDQPLATPAGRVVPLSNLAALLRIDAPPQINRSARQRAVTLQFTPPTGLPLEEAIAQVEQLLGERRADGTIPLSVDTSYTGSASKLAAVQNAMLGDGTLFGTLSSSLFLAVLVVYLLMCVLFQSFLRPLIILFSVPLATLGGFAGLWLVHRWSLSSRYMPVQNLDILTMLGFVILIGVVVNNAILIVHQTIQFMKGEGDTGEFARAPMRPREAIAEAVRTRVRPIFMSTLTSVGGMAPLVLMPGSGSELYRGLGSVVVGGLLVSTVFTLLLVPLLLSLVSDVQERLGLLPEQRALRVAGARTLGLPAVLPLFLAALALGHLAGCAHSSRAAPVSIPRLVETVNERELMDLGPPAGLARRLEQPSSGVESSVQQRRAELDELGGPQSWRSIQPGLAPSLVGEEHTLAPIDLGTALTTSVRENLGLELARLAPSIAEEGITIAEAAFDPALYAEGLASSNRDLRAVPVLGGIQLGTPRSAYAQSSLDAGVRKRVRSGATITAGTFLEYTDDKTDGFAYEPDPSWRTGLSAGIVQPLLRGFGSEVSGTDIELARNEHSRSLLDLRAELLLLVALTEEAYWDLEEAWSRLRIQQRLTEQGAEVEAVLAERRSFDAALAQFSDAQATVERRRADLLRAERGVKAASDRLKALMDSELFPLGGEALLQPTSGFTSEPIEYQLREAVALGLAERPEIRRALTEIEDAQLRERLADNLLLPQLDLVASVSLVGLDEGADSSYSSLVSDDVLSYLVGLSFQLPIENRAARSELRQRELEQRAALVRYERVVREVVREIKDALRDLRTSYELIGATRSSRIAESENLRALLVEKESRGRLSPEFLNLEFQRQERLALAQAREVEALANYERSLAAYYRAIGSGGALRRIFAPRAEESGSGDSAEPEGGP